ncbi:heterokaryon incompatibility protein-domain-containing protein, partial [Bipolaris maydis]
MSQYSYSPLPTGSDSIRLLRLMPHKDETANIKCELFEHSLHNLCRTHLYEALSYEWGNPKEKLPVFIHEHSFNVTINLHAALSRLRNHSMERILWADAICINQNDNKEKSEQVLIMGEIYSRATKVYAWLGEADRQIDCVFDVLQDDLDDDILHKEFNWLRPLYLQPYWRRVWIVQELVLAKVVVVCCGDKSID